MQEDGKGFSLTATDVRGLEVVLRFTAAGPHDRYPRLIPCRAVDKLLLGIVPGDPLLVNMDFPMVLSDGKIQDIASPGSILSKIGFSDSRRNEIGGHRNPEVKHDIITLLLPFLPLEGSTMASYCFPGWHCEPGIRNVHCYWEARIALHRRLEERIEGDQMSPALTRTLQYVLERMDLLEQRHGDNWYARWVWSPSIRNRQEWHTKLGAINGHRSNVRPATSQQCKEDYIQLSAGMLPSRTLWSCSLSMTVVEETISNSTRQICSWSSSSYLL